MFHYLFNLTKVFEICNDITYKVYIYRQTNMPIKTAGVLNIFNFGFQLNPNKYFV